MADHPRIEELRRRVLADPASIAFAALAEEYRRSGKYNEAIETCRTGLQRHPSYLSARVTLGRALIETAQYDLARHELELVLKSAPENLAAIRGLAEIHERLGDHADHEAAFGSATAAPEPPPPAAPPQPKAVEPAVDHTSSSIESVLRALPVQPEPAARVAVAAAPPAAPAPAVPAPPKIAVEPVKIAAAPVAVPNAVPAPQPVPVASIPLAKAAARPDPVVTGLERFLAAIQTARASAPNGR